MEKDRPKGEGLKLKLYCPHQSSNISLQTISKPNRRSSGFTAMNDIIDQMNANKGTADPSVEIEEPFNVVTKTGNNLDAATTNDYIFEAVKALTAVDEIIEREGTPVEVGGSFQFNFMRFKSKYDHGTGQDLDVVQLQVFQQGFMTSNGTDFQNIPQVTLTKPLLSPTTRSNTLELQSELETEKGTNLIAIGSRGGGTYPLDYARFLGAKTVFTGAQLWEDGREYFVGQLVRYEFGATGLQTFECIQENIGDLGVNDPTTGLGTFWVGALTFSIKEEWAAGNNYAETFAVTHNEISYEAAQTHISSVANEPPNVEFWNRLSFYPTTNYSPLTNHLNSGQQQAGYLTWMAAMGGAKYRITDNSKTAMVDPSVVVQDNFHPRTWVDTVSNDSAVVYADGNLMKNNLPFDGFRVLCVNPATGDGSVGLGDFAGNDVSGTPYAGNVIEYRDPNLNQTGTWVVFRDAQQADYEVYAFDESDSWTNAPCEGLDRGVNDNGACVLKLGGGGASRTGGWVKGAYAISEAPNGSVAVFVQDRSFQCVHAVGWDSDLMQVDMGNENIKGLSEYGSDDSAVFVVSDMNDLNKANHQFVGLNFAFPWPRQNIGSVPIGDQINLPMFDLDNMHLTQTGTREWFGPRVEDYFPIQDFAFFQYLLDTTLFDPLNALAGSTTRRSADYTMGVWLADRNDVIITMEYNYSHNGLTFPQSASISKQKIFRAVPGTSPFIAAQNPEVLDIFDFRNVVRGGIYTRDSFDEQNRFLASRSRFGALGALGGGGFRSTSLKMSIDAFRMSKPLVCTNADEPNNKNERNIEPQKLRYEKISNYAQLKNYVLSQEAILGFRTDRYDVQTPGRCNIAYGDPVFYNDTEALDETFQPSGLNLANTVRATAHKITYSLSKTADGQGGFLRNIELITRLYPDDTP